MTETQKKKRIKDYSVRLLQGNVIRQKSFETMVNYLIELFEGATGKRVKNKPFRLELDE